MATVGLAVGAALVIAAGPAAAWDGFRGDRGGGVRTRSNLTGTGSGVIVTNGATRADTVTANSATGGDANAPERAVPNGSGGRSGG